MLPKMESLIQQAFLRPANKTWAGDDPRLDFPGTVFTGDNWNDARLSLLRNLVGCLEVGEAREFDWDGNNAHMFRCYLEDQNYVFIRVEGSLYHIEWYKSRGRTEVVNKDGQPITLVELQILIRHLAEAFGPVLLGRMAG